jgi:uncharacterized surface protein with fasciclin (FAS1) repeats
MKPVALSTSKLFITVILAFGFLNFASVAMADNYGKANYHGYWRGSTVADIVINTHGLDTLEAALAANNLVELFEGRKRYTVFAPTNEAFEELGLTPESKLTDLEAVLGYHVVKGKLSLKEVVTAGELQMLLSGTTTTGVSSNGAFIQGTGNAEESIIVVKGIRARNGAVYVIDKVLLPN